MEYLGCEKESGICDRCGAIFEYLHHLMTSQRRPRRFCKGCAEQAVSHHIDRQTPEFTEARCRQEGGKWVSCEQGEKDHERAEGANLA
jgi:hypothetical protein